MSTNYIPSDGTKITFKKVYSLCKNPGDNVQFLWQPSGDDDNWKPVGSKDKLSPDYAYAISDGTNWLQLEFDDAGVLSSVDRYGANDVEDLLAFLGGDFVSEHDDEYWESAKSPPTSVKVRRLIDSLLK